MACVTACPSGVQYAPLIEATRGQIERHYPRSLGDRLFPERDLRAVSVSAAAAHRAGAARRRGWVTGAVRAIRLRRAPPDRQVRTGRARARAGAAPEFAIQLKSLTFERKRLAGKRKRLPILRGNGMLARLGAMLELAPTVTARSLVGRVRARTPAVGDRRLTSAS
jgi:Fe-S oxidoreductase